MPVAVVNGVTFDSRKPCEIHTVSWNGRTFTAGSFLLAALFAFQEWLDEKHPNYFVYVAQGAFNTTVEASRGSHDFDGAVDILIIHRTTGRKVWLRGQWWLRTHHFYAWLRNTGSWLAPSKWHFHMIVAGIVNADCQVGSLIPSQILDAQQGKTGLVGHLLDPTRKPKRYIPFPYRAWVQRKEFEMQLTQEQLDQIRGVVRAEVEAAWQKKQSNGLTRAANLLTAAVAALKGEPK